MKDNRTIEQRVSSLENVVRLQLQFIDNLADLLAGQQGIIEHLAVAAAAVRPESRAVPITVLN